MTESLQDVGGPLRPSPVDDFGRPPGTENRPAGVVAMAGAVVLLAATFPPWAVYRPDVIGHAVTGWRDASGGVGDGLALAVVATLVAVVAERCLTGRLGRGLQRALWAGSLAAVTVLALSWRNIVTAQERVSDLSDGAVVLLPGWGLFLGLAGALLVAAGARLCRVGPV